MQIKNKKQIISISLSVIVSVFLVGISVYAVTTISGNIVTGGTLSVTGTASLSTASTTGDFWLGNQVADDDDYLYMDASSTEYFMWDDSANQFVFSNGVILPSATTSDSFYITGLASTSAAVYVGMLSAAGDDYLYFDESESLESLMWDDSADQFVFSNGLSIPSATTTDSLYIGGIASTTGAVYVGMLSAAGDDYLYFDESESLESLMWDDTPGMFTISDDLNVTGVASSTEGFRLNDHFIINSSGIATTTENFIIGDGNSTATSTLEIGDADTAGCLKIRDADADAWTYCYTDGGAMICSAIDVCNK